MAGARRFGLMDEMESNVLVRVAAYYIVLTAGVVALWHFFPEQAQRLLINPVQELPATGISKREAAEVLSQSILHDPIAAVAGVASTSAIAMMCSLLLSLPVAWVYTLTRQKKGYRQSVVQTLVILPLVVSAVVVLVKNSLALAFSLAGIVAAVRFRNTLEDSKDAVYIFVATAVGLASGVQVTSAVVLSVVFNMAIIALWYTDFGRSPANLEGKHAERRLERAMAIANRTGMFVAKVDEEILKSMSPEQLDALADRAWRRKRKATSEQREDGDAPVENGASPYARLLRIHTREVSALRQAVESAFPSRLERWRFGGVIHEANGIEVVEYGATLKDGVEEDDFLEAVREQGGVHVVGIRLV